MIIGAHSVLYSRNAEADREFLRDILEFPNVDVGHGWLIFGLPPSEVAIHPSDESDRHEFYLMCEDIGALLGKLEDRGIAVSPIQEEQWGSLVHVSLPSGSKLGIYEPKHARPPEFGGKKKRVAKKATRPRKKAASKIRSKSRGKGKSRSKR